MFAHPEEQDAGLKPMLVTYYAALNPEQGILCKRRKNYEQSANLINEALTELMNVEEEKTQRMFPYHFEKYKTDGIEFTIYVDASLFKFTWVPRCLSSRASPKYSLKTAVIATHNFVRNGPPEWRFI